MLLACVTLKCFPLPAACMLLHPHSACSFTLRVFVRASQNPCSKVGRRRTEPPAFDFRQLHGKLVHDDYFMMTGSRLSASRNSDEPNLEICIKSLKKRLYLLRLFVLNCSLCIIWRFIHRKSAFVQLLTDKVWKCLLFFVSNPEIRSTEISLSDKIRKVQVVLSRIGPSWTTSCLWSWLSFW